MRFPKEEHVFDSPKAYRIYGNFFTYNAIRSDFKIPRHSLLRLHTYAAHYVGSWFCV